MTFFFRQIGGGEIDGDAAGRKRKVGSNERSTHVLLGLRHSFVRQPDDGPCMSLMPTAIRACRAKLSPHPTGKSPASNKSANDSAG
jgi:hypothetical protein